MFLFKTVHPLGGVITKKKTKGDVKQHGRRDVDATGEATGATSRTDAKTNEDTTTVAE